VSRSIQSGGIANVGGFIQSVQIAGDNNAAANVTSLTIQNGSGAPNTSTTSNNSTTSSSSTGSGTSSSAGITSTGSMASTNSSTSTTSPGDTGNGTTGGADGIASTTNTGTATSTGRTATVGGSTVSSTYSNNSAEVTTSIDGQGTASQFMHPGSLGQEIQLATDNAVVTNQMIVNLVTQQMSSTEQLAHTLAQSLNLSHFTGH
jgi:hypothetical protein